MLVENPPRFLWCVSNPLQESINKPSVQNSVITSQFVAANTFIHIFMIDSGCMRLFSALLPLYLQMMQSVLFLSISAVDSKYFSDVRIRFLKIRSLCFISTYMSVLILWPTALPLYPCRKSHYYEWIQLALFYPLFYFPTVREAQPSCQPAWSIIANFKIGVDKDDTLSDAFRGHLAIYQGWLWTFGMLSEHFPLVLGTYTRWLWYGFTGGYYLRCQFTMDILVVYAELSQGELWMIAVEKWVII